VTHQPWKLPFAAFWTAQAFSLFGSSLAQFALVWWLTLATGSATVLALATLVATLPGIVVGPFAGVLVDRWDRRAIIACSDSLAALVALGLAALAWLGAIAVWHVLAAMCLRSLAGAFQLPAVQSSTSLMVPPEQLARVNGLSQMLAGLMQLVAPALGALLLSWLPLQAIMGIDVVTAVIAVALVLLIHIPRPIRATPTEGAASVLADLRAGLAYIWRWPALIGILLISALLNLLLVPAFSLLPILVTRHFEGGAAQLAWLEVAFAAGIVVGGALLGVWGGFKRRIVTGALGVAGLGVGTLLVGIAPAQLIGLAVAGMLVAGMMNACANGPMLAILQAVVAPDMQGRVFTVTMSASMAVSPVGLLIAGPLADLIGVQAWYILGGSACILMCAVILATPALLHIEENP